MGNGGKNITQKQKKFCEMYLSDEFRGNATKAYQAVFRVSYETAKTNGSRLLTNAHISEEIRKILDEQKLNPERIDAEWYFLITQNENLSVKMQAIREFNRVKQRIQTSARKTVLLIDIDELDL